MARATRNAGRRFGVLVLLVALLLPTSASAQLRPRSVQDAYVPILYVVEGGTAPVYLYGSLHIAPPDVLPPPAAAREAFARSSRLATEVILSEEAEAEASTILLSLAFFDDGSGLSDYLSESEYSKVVSRAEEAGIPASSVESIRPWALQIFFSESGGIPAGFSARYGLDRYFTEKARARGVEIVGLESVEDQTQALAGGTVKEQIDSLFVSLEADPVQEVLELHRQWRSGNVEKLSAMVATTIGTEGDAYYERLLGDRNERWISVLEPMINGTQTTFVVVGAAHLVGDSSVQRLLAERGYTTRRILSIDEL